MSEQTSYNLDGNFAGLSSGFKSELIPKLTGDRLPAVGRGREEECSNATGRLFRFSRSR